MLTGRRLPVSVPARTQHVPGNRPLCIWQPRATRSLPVHMAWDLEAQPSGKGAEFQHACYRCQHACYGPNMRFCKNHMSTLMAEFCMMLQNSNMMLQNFNMAFQNFNMAFQTSEHGVSKLRRACMLQMRTWENLSLFEPSKTGAPPAPHCAHP